MAETNAYAKKKIIFLLVLTIIVFFIEISVAYSSHSQALGKEFALIVIVSML